MINIKNKNKTKIIPILMVLALIFSYSCSNEAVEIPLASIEINNTDIVLDLDEVKQLLVKASPSNTTQTLIWETSSAAVAEIQHNANGLVAGVKGKSVGSTVLTAKSVDGSLTKSINVSVIIKTKDIQLSIVGGIPEDNVSSVTYQVDFIPANATNKDIVWSSSDENVATVTNGLVETVGEGNATITATRMAVEGEDEKTVFADITSIGTPPLLLFNYCTPSGTAAYNVAAVKTTGGSSDIDYTGGTPVDNYEFITNQLLEVKRGSTFNLAVTNENGWSRTIVWIDWNGDLDFNDANERFEPFSAEKFYSGDPGETYNKDITVPNDAFVGDVRIRVLSGDAWTYEDAEIPNRPCGELYSSTIKDFKVTILE